MYSRPDLLAQVLLDRGYLIVDAEAGEVWHSYGRAENLDKRTGYGRVVVYSRPLTLAMAHRIVWMSVHGLIPRGLQVNHINRHGWDNRLCNLEVVSPLGNARHALGRVYDACGPDGNVNTEWLHALDTDAPPPDQYDPYNRGHAFPGGRFIS
jgi:hypothetical protein